MEAQGGLALSFRKERYLSENETLVLARVFEGFIAESRAGARVS